MVKAYGRSKRMGELIDTLDAITEATRDYFDDELTAQLNMTRGWLQETLTTIRRHELQRLSVVNLISRGIGENPSEEEKHRGVLKHSSTD